MITNEEFDTVTSIVSKIELKDFFIFDTRQLSTSIDDRTASWLIYLSKYTSKIYEAIVDLYTFDITGCIDSEIL